MDVAAWRVIAQSAPLIEDSTKFLICSDNRMVRVLYIGHDLKILWPTPVDDGLEDLDCDWYDPDPRIDVAELIAGAYIVNTWRSVDMLFTDGLPHG